MPAVPLLGCDNLIQKKNPIRTTSTTRELWQYRQHASSETTEDIALHIPTSNNGYHVKLSSDHSVGYPHFLLETPTYHKVLHTHQSSIGTHGNNNPFIRHPSRPPSDSQHAMRRSQSTGREPADLHQGHPPPVTLPVRVASQAVTASLEAPMYLHYYPVPYFVALRDALDFLLPTPRSLC